ncbi:Uncharacterised protein [uncultured archaeon]|nr:Uncharacterised protein [uncultured archaeon]
MKKRVLMMLMALFVTAAVSRADTATVTDGKLTVSKASWTAYVTAKGQAKTAEDYAKVAELAPFPAGKAWAWYNAARLVVWTPDFKVIQGLSLDQKKKKKKAAGYLAHCEAVMAEERFTNKKLLVYIQEVKDTIEGKK